jgi:hypothetical protein
MKRKKWVRPAKPWNTTELVNLQIPVERERREQFAKLYLQKTGYAFEGEIMEMSHALMLITGIYQPIRATETAVRYLMAGILTFPQRNKAVLKDLWACEEVEFVIRQFGIDEAIQYLARYEGGLTPWQFVLLTNSLAWAKAAVRRRASAKNMQATKEKSPECISAA